MAQKTQFLMTKQSASMHVQPDDVATYLADGWTINGIRYSEGGDLEDAHSLVKMVKGPAAIYVRPIDYPLWKAEGYRAVQVIYGTARHTLELDGDNLNFLDVPVVVSAEIGAVDAETLVVTFSTEVAAEDFAAGVTIEVDESPVEIGGAVRQADHKVVHYDIPAVAEGEAVTWSYDDDEGGIASELDGSPLSDVTEQEVTNSVEDE